MILLLEKVLLRFFALILDIERVFRINVTVGVSPLASGRNVFLQVSDDAILLAYALLELTDQLVVGEKILTIVSSVVLCDSGGAESLAVSFRAKA